MYFNKYPLSHNFSFSNAYSSATGFDFPNVSHAVRFQTLGNNIFRLTVTGGAWERNFSQVEYRIPEGDSDGAYSLQVSDSARIRLVRKDGTVLLDSFPKGSFGRCGEASVFRFLCDANHRYYGAGSKLLSIEHTGRKTKFWNTDVMADFPHEHFQVGHPDPYYVSIPYLIIKTPNGWVGLLYNNPEACFLSVGAMSQIESFATVKTDDTASVNIGAESGQPDLFVLAAPSLAELTRNFQHLVGLTPLPPVWSLGYQQCRWGYESVADLRGLRAKFEEHAIPVDGLWLDIDYMDGYRVFSVDSEKIPEPEKEFSEMLGSGHPVVPIIDPGVKYDPGHPVYESGKSADIYCKNPEGNDFIGLVWPGLTVFPDYSREEARNWWADQVESFAKQGIIGAWLDMNDPSVGKSNPYDMLWGEGGENPHRTFHNQYGMGMAKATRAGFERAHPGKRIFLLTRSNHTGGGKYAAVWNGDNISNYHYLRMSIPTTLNLALSGIPFNGSDVGGFGGNVTPALLRDWMKSAFLAPFFRNHSVLKSRQQEPWAFDELTLDVCRNFIRMRYLLMPYLYNLFVDQAERGEAIMRPLFYDFQSTGELDLDRVDDAFLIGPSILQAPFLQETGTTRSVPLPGAQRWYDPFSSEWFSGNQRLASVARDESFTPLYFREGAIIPLRRDAESSQITDLSRVDLLVVADEESELKTPFEYVADDGLSLGYQKGERSRVKGAVEVSGGTLKIVAEPVESGFGEIQFRIMTLVKFEHVEWNGTEFPLVPVSIDVAGKRVTLFRVDY